MANELSVAHSAEPASAPVRRPCGPHPSRPARPALRLAPWGPCPRERLAGRVQTRLCVFLPAPFPPCVGAGTRRFEVACEAGDLVCFAATTAGGGAGHARPQRRLPAPHTRGGAGGPRVCGGTPAPPAPPEGPLELTRLDVLFDEHGAVGVDGLALAGLAGPAVEVGQADPEKRGHGRALQGEERQVLSGAIKRVICGTPPPLSRRSSPTARASSGSPAPRPPPLLDETLPWPLPRKTPRGRPRPQTALPRTGSQKPAVLGPVREACGPRLI